MTGHIDVAHWHGVVGGIVAWLYRNTPGNLVASAIAFTAGWWAKGHQILDHLDALHRHHQIGKYKK